MAMPRNHQKFISDSTAQAQTILACYSMLSQLNALWAGAPAYHTAITQAEIDSVPTLFAAVVTAQQLADAEYALSLILGNITTSLVPLSIMAEMPFPSNSA